MLFNSSRGSDAEECCEKDNGCCSCCCCGCCLSRGDADWSSAGVDIDAGTSNGTEEEEEDEGAAVLDLILALAKKLGVENDAALLFPPLLVTSRVDMNCRRGEGA